MSTVVMRNSRGGDAPPPPPTHEDGSLYPYAMYYDGYKYIAYADSPSDLLDVLITGYAEMEDQEQLVARIKLAINAQVAVQASINAQATDEQLAALNDKQRAVLNGPRFEQPHGWAEDPEMGDFWDSQIPLVLVETGYAPYTQIDRPISGIADVENPPNMIWLRPQEEWEFLQSLTNAGFIDIKIATDL